MAQPRPTLIPQTTTVPDGVLTPSTPAADRLIACPVCTLEGVLAEFDPARGFLITHAGRLSCRAPADPPGVVDGQVAVPVEISTN